MADTDDDDEFGLDDSLLDDIPDIALVQLERDAFQATQGRSNVKRTTNNPSYRPPKSTNNPPYRPPRPILRQQNQESFASERTVQSDRPPSDYGLDDEDVIDLDDQPYAVSQGHNQVPNYSRLAGQQPQIQQHELVEDSFMTADEHPQVNVAELQQRVLQLENDRISLEHAVEEARAVAQSKAGEAAILRQKTEKAAREYDQKVSTLRQLHAEEHAKQKAELERVKNEREKVVTNNKFLEHDLALEAGKTRQFQKAMKTGAGAGQRQGDVTPKKSRVLPFRDGFDDNDLIMLSPSKPRSKPSTPKAGVKRKRNVNDNSPMAPPIPALQLSEPKLPPTPLRPTADPQITFDLFQQLSIDESKLRFMQNILSEPVNSHDENIFEALSGYTFPSAPKTKLSTLVYEQLTSQSFVYQGADISSHFCNMLLSLWERCLKEKHYDPITVLVDAIHLVLDSESLAFSRKFIKRIVPLAIATSDIVAIPIARAFINKQTVEDEDDLSNHINVLSCLKLLLTVAQASALYVQAKTQFWQHMKFDFVLLILMKAQPLPQIRVMLQLLQTSALETTFGAILSADEGGADRQARRQVDMIDRLTLLLFEIPTFAADSASHFHSDLVAMRLDVLLVLQAICMPEEGGQCLASHTFAIARLFKVLHQSIQSLPFVASDPNTHPLVIGCVNTAMRLIFHLITTFKDLVDVRQKVSVIQGGTSILLISLTRLAFVERVYAEEGISEASMDMAHRLLDEWLSPDEGEALLAMFSSDRSEG